MTFISISEGLCVTARNSQGDPVIFEKAGLQRHPCIHLQRRTTFFDQENKIEGFWLREQNTYSAFREI